MNDGLRRVTVYCASSTAVPPAYHLQAAELGRGIARAGWELVFGGGSTGLMGTLGRAALEEGGRVRSVILDRFVAMGIGLEGVTALEVLEDLRPRKARLEELGDVFAALPGGFGTLEELSEILVRKQIGLHAKPLVILNSDGFYDPLFAFFRRAHAEGFIGPEVDGLYRAAGTSAEALAIIEEEMPR